MEQVEASIERYLRALDQADREESDIAEAKSVRLKQKIAGLRQQMQALKVMEQTVPDAPDLQVSLTDPNARSMATQPSHRHCRTRTLDKVKTEMSLHVLASNLKRMIAIFGADR